KQFLLAVFDPQAAKGREIVPIDPACLPTPQLFEQGGRERMVDLFQKVTDLPGLDGMTRLQIVAERGNVAQALTLSEILPEQVGDNQILGPPIRRNDDRSPNRRPRVA